MKRILINKKIIDLSKDYCRNLFANKSNGFKMPLDKLCTLSHDLQNSQMLQNANDYMLYVRMIISKYPIINRIGPKYFDDFHQKYFSQFTNVQLDIKIGNKKFYELVVNAMRYTDARFDYYPFALKLGIKTCIYCNAQLAATTKNNNGSYKGTYELDHFYPKSKYPYLCTSFFNLQPCCAHCNKSKSDNKAEFGLYTTDYKKLNPFKFAIDKKSLIKYMLKQDCEELEIIFDSNEANLLQDHDQHFHIKELYDTQKDLAEEIIWKSKIYNKSYQQILRDSFAKLFSKHTDFNRFILGNYYKQEDIHKRPMAKFVQDIAKQLRLIE
jgi:5-methylcytosine-specific restriction endonuclease McrA